MPKENNWKWQYNSIDLFIRPIISQLVAFDHSNTIDEAYKHFSTPFGQALKFNECYRVNIKLLLGTFWDELIDATQIQGFDQFCAELLQGLKTNSILE